jgi:hypothetical protein
MFSGNLRLPFYEYQRLFHPIPNQTPIKIIIILHIINKKLFYSTITIIKRIKIIKETYSHVFT